jgi:succinate dehydrogenase / fumarate reductase, cytochrome b subunit
MNNFIRYSSITKKIVMGLAGLFLALFLCVHLVINLLLLCDDGGQMFMAASAFMSGNIVIRIFEVVLFGGFILHIIVGLIVTFTNWAARPVRYYKSNRSETSFFSKYMFHTGAIIFIFLILHFFHFFFVKLGWVNAPAGLDPHDFYNMSILLFQNKLYSIIYLVFFVFLAFHLNHSIQSGLQTLGLNHNKYNKAIKYVSAMYAIIISGGFAVIPIYFMFIY